MAEVEIRGGRRHRRIIGDAPSDPLLHGKPLFYSDTYIAADSPTTYVYARHKADPSLFFTTLNFFLEEHTSSEFAAWQYSAMVNLGGELVERSVKFPVLDDNSLIGPDADLRFCRLHLPFGDIAVEFCNTAVASSNDLETARARRQIARSLEAPLLGCDLSKSEMLAKFMIAVHWASDFVPPTILEGLVAELSQNLVSA